MKAKERRINAWLDFIQADLDALRLDKLILVIYPIYEDFLLHKIQIKKAAMDLLRLSSGNHEGITLPKELEGVLKIIDDSAKDKYSIILRSLSWWDWNDLQKEAKNFMEKILAGEGSYVTIRVDEFLFQMPSGMFRKSTHLLEGGFVKEIVPILIDLFDGIQRSAFKRCPECEKWFFHTSKREKEYCTNRCASRYLTRKKRTKSGKAREEYNKKMREYMKKRHQENNPKSGSKELLECPGNPDDPLDVEITPTECINPDGKNIRGKWHACSTCPNFKKGGEGE